MAPTIIHGDDQARCGRMALRTPCAGSPHSIVCSLALANFAWEREIYVASPCRRATCRYRDVTIDQAPLASTAGAASHANAPRRWRSQLSMLQVEPAAAKNRASDAKT
jgi:hypothetical protein